MRSATSSSSTTLSDASRTSKNASSSFVVAINNITDSKNDATSLDDGLIEQESSRTDTSTATTTTTTKDASTITTAVVLLTNVSDNDNNPDDPKTKTIVHESSKNNMPNVEEMDEDDEDEAPSRSSSSSSFVCEIDREAFTFSSHSQLIQSILTETPPTNTTSTSDKISDDLSIITTHETETDDDNKDNHHNQTILIPVNQRNLILMLSAPRSGSNLLYHIFQEINDFTSISDLDLLGLGDVFSPNWLYRTQQKVMDRLLPICQLGGGKGNGNGESNHHGKSAKKAERTREQWHQKMDQILQNVTREHHEKLWDLYLRNTTTTSSSHTKGGARSSSSSSSSDGMLPLLPWAQRLVEMSYDSNQAQRHAEGIMTYFRSIPAFASLPQNNHVLFKLFPFPLLGIAAQTAAASLSSNHNPAHRSTPTLNAFYQALSYFLQMIQRIWTTTTRTNTTTRRSSSNTIKIVVLWRRSFLNHYVSYQRAFQSHQYISRKSSNDTNNNNNNNVQITIDKKKIDAEFTYWFHYNQGFHKILTEYGTRWRQVMDEHNNNSSSDGSNTTSTTNVNSSSTNRMMTTTTTTTTTTTDALPHIVYDVVEYEDDLLDEAKQSRTAQRMMDFVFFDESSSSSSSSLQATTTTMTDAAADDDNDDDATSLQQLMVSSIPIRKQSVIPLKDQIANWKDVVAWGYGQNVGGHWDDIFAPNRRPMDFLAVYDK